MMDECTDWKGKRRVQRGQEQLIQTCVMLVLSGVSKDARSQYHFVYPVQHLGDIVEKLTWTQGHSLCFCKQEDT